MVITTCQTIQETCKLSTTGMNTTKSRINHIISSTCFMILEVIDVKEIDLFQFPFLLTGTILASF